MNTPLFTRAYDYNGSNSFTLHNAHLAVKHAFTDNVSAVIELDGGYDAYANNLVANAGSSVPMGGFIDVQEAYATASTSGFSFTAGRFVTYQGIEVVEGPLDPTITRGFLYTWAEPISHAGFKAHYATGPIDMGLGLVNGWDKILADNNNWKTLIWRAGVSVEMFWAGFSGTYGAEGVTDDNKRLSLDLTGAVTPIEMLAINFQANYGSEPNAGYGDDPMGVPTLGLDDATWLGFGVQPVLTVDAFSLGARVEWFNDTNGARLLVDDTSYVNFTITPGYTFDEAFTVRAEYRMDTASNDVFVKDAYDSRDPTTGEPIPELTGSQSTIAVGVDYQF